MSPAQLESRWLGRVSYDETLALQNRLAREVRDGTSPPLLLLLEHDPIFTIGRTRDQSSLGELTQLPYPVREINRGGQATYHGPGQLVAYPIIDLHHHGRDLHRYLRFLEDVIISTLAHYAIVGTRRDGLTGVWVNERKIASIGVGVRHWVTMHGLALNISGPLDGFDAITPCGITNVAITSIERELGTAPSVHDSATTLDRHFRRLIPTLN